MFWKSLEYPTGQVFPKQIWRQKKKRKEKKKEENAPSPLPPATPLLSPGVVHHV